MSDSSRREGSSSSSRPRMSPCSPFPFGSPLQQGLDQSSFSGSPGQKLLLDSFPGASNKSNRYRTTSEVVTPRLKGQDMYGGLVMFGGGSSFRRNRMLSASPYSAGLRSRQTERMCRVSGASSTPGPPPPPAQGNYGGSLPSTAPSSPSPGPHTDSMSSTAKLILDTLDKMSTPIQDAKKMPTLIQPRAEKRKLIEEELNCSLRSPQRRRVRLGSGALSLGGPPLRKMYSPVPSPLTNGLSVSVPASPHRSDSQGSMAPPLPTPTPSPPCPIHPTSNSTFKVKNKVSESGRRKVADTASTCPPPSSPGFLTNTNILEMDSMPVFSLAPPTPVPNGVEGKIEEEEEEEEDVLENNNNKKKRSLEEEPGSSSNKRMAGSAAPLSASSPMASMSSPIVFSTKPSTVTSSSSSSLVKSSPPVAEDPIPSESTQSTPLPPSVSSVASPSFTFASPTIVITQEEDLEVAPYCYTFCPPSTLSSHRVPNTCTTTTTATKASRTISNQGDRRLASSVSSLIPPQPKIMFSMPDVTNNLVRKLPAKDTLKGANPSSRLPDLTASTGFGGFGPAKELKAGSVMDILGKNA